MDESSEKVNKVEENLKKMLREADPIFTRVDNIAKEFLDGKTKETTYYYNTLEVLSGCYTHLVVGWKQLEAQKQNAEVRQYMVIKQECTTSGEKFVSASAEREASASVRQLRQVRNIFEGYVLACAESIRTCKKRIGGYEEGRQVEL